MTTKPTYTAYAEELTSMLAEDQKEWREYAKAEFESDDVKSLKDWHDELRQRVNERTNRTLAILQSIGEPKLSNIGDEASLAMSVLATHGSLAATKTVLDAFMKLYASDKNSVRYQSIPAMTDWACLLEKRPQVFGTIWLFDEQKYPFLPTVDDFEHVNDRRSECGIEPLRWPKSLAIPESQQPWLRKPLDGHVMRDPTSDEYMKFADDYL